MRRVLEELRIDLTMLLLIITRLTFPITIAEEVTPPAMASIADRINIKICFASSDKGVYYRSRTYKMPEAKKAIP